MIDQIAIFAENKKGEMKRITGLLAGSGININSLVTNDSAEFGIVRLITDDSDKAANVLKNEGYMVHIDRVIAIEMPDQPGGMYSILEHIDNSNINIDYIYISFDRERAVPIAVIHAPDSYELEEGLESKGFKTL